MEHLPRAAAVYDVTPLEYEEAKQWLQKRHPVSIIRTTEMIAAVQAALGYSYRNQMRPWPFNPAMKHF